ncbi:putative interleukin-17 receptor E-like [Terrapene carolina triunguis]|uniref:putative interleukin-17 receptor E-like n=1 Tax=Terrapene triunguis TaxID=2587831 RepID=UPI001156A144|nr:putative interleukin-17 receptor E-like [Terrapene carolina triunguis]
MFVIFFKMPHGQLDLYIYVFLTFTAGIFNSFCRDAPASLSSTVLKSMKLSTAMKCVQGSQCSLHLSIKATLNLDENIRGLEICSLSAEMQQSQCVNVRFSRKTSNKLVGRKVHVQFNCFEVNVAQHIYVTMKTIPNYCEVKMSQEYYVEDCRNNDVGKHIPVCFGELSIIEHASHCHCACGQLLVEYVVDSVEFINAILQMNEWTQMIGRPKLQLYAEQSGKLDYNVDRVRKTISVNVSDFLQDQDYYVRLCHKWFTCEDVGSFALIKGKESLKSISLQYSQLLPCLCIEGWSAIPDARRTQLCPFKNDTKALWDNIVYNPATQTLAWEPACPVHVTVNLCRLTKSNDQCVDLQNSSTTAPEKQVKYSRVDTHPRLCMKFTTKQGSWVRCPFAHGNFPAWKMRIAAGAEQIQVSFMSQTKAQFSVLVCNKAQLSSCDSVGIRHSVSAGDSHPTSVNISGEICGSQVCIQGWRTDVDYSVPLQICDIQCTLSSRSQEDDENSIRIMLLTAIILILVTMMALLGHKILTVFHRKKHDSRSPAQIIRQSFSTRVKSTSSLH